jgi:hypothetical protein
MTKDTIDELLELTLEMEGLLTLMLKRDDMTPPRVTAMLERKALRFNELLGLQPAAPLAQAAEPAVQTAVEAADAEEIIEAQATVETVRQQAVAESAELEQQEDAEPQSEPDEIQVPAPESETVTAPEAAEEQHSVEDEAPKVLNDVLAKGPLKFTINDRFRFRNNLFDSNDEEFEGTLAIISNMSTMDEVSDYLYNDLCLDADNEDVKAFVAVLTAHFN